MGLLAKVSVSLLCRQTFSIPCLTCTSRASYVFPKSYCSNRAPALQNEVAVNPHHESPFAAADTSYLADLARNLRPTFNFAAYINKSKSLQDLVDLGVELYRYENKLEDAEYILKLNFENDVKPYVQFLCDNNVEPDDLGKIFSKNIRLCQESLEDLQVRINYLESKSFTKEMIGTIISRNPYWLTTPVSLIDSRLGWLQKNYKLSGDDVRMVVNALPTIVTFKIETIKLNNFVFEEEMGMTKSSIRKMLIQRPRLFVKNQKKLLASFEFVHNVMKMPVDRICHQPDILMSRLHSIRERHLFLQSLGRAQYNPNLPGYVSLDSISKGDDATFVSTVAKSSILSYNSFLKTL